MSNYSAGATGLGIPFTHAVFDRFYNHYRVKCISVGSGDGYFEHASGQSFILIEPVVRKICYMKPDYSYVKR